MTGKKKLRQYVPDRRHLIDMGHPDISINKQCELLQVSKGALYYQPRPIEPYTLTLMNLIDEQHTKTPFYGSRKLKAWLNQQGYKINRKRVQRLMRLMRIEAIYPKPKLSGRDGEHKVYPKDWGETVQAVVVPAKDAEITSEELSDFLKTRLAKFKIPRKYHFTKELPHTPSGKVMKFNSTTQLNLCAGIYCILKILSIRYIVFNLLSVVVGLNYAGNFNNQHEAIIKISNRSQSIREI